MTTRTIVTLPNGAKFALDDLATADVIVCDGCGHIADEGQEFIPAQLAILPSSDRFGEGCQVAVHLCGRHDCRLTSLARKFEAIWPLPQVAETAALAVVAAWLTLNAVLLLAFARAGVVTVTVRKPAKPRTPPEVGK